MDFLICDIHIKMISGSKGQKAVRACTIRLLNLFYTLIFTLGIFLILRFYMLIRITQQKHSHFCSLSLCTLYIYAVALTIAKLDFLVDIGH